ncbi:MAG: hypothetical protein LUD76_08580 [Alistipes sp.]|nr:hypothetical protein [Alistipes sp.]
MKTLSGIIPSFTVLFALLICAGCSDSLPERVQVDPPAEPVPEEVCPDGTQLVRSIPYNIPPNTLSGLLEPERAYLITSKKELETYFPDTELEPVDFSAYSLFFVQGGTNYNCAYVGSDVWNDDGHYILKARVYTGVATVMDHWAVGRLVPVMPEDILGLEAEVSHPSLGEAVWLDPVTVDIPVECNPDGIVDNEAVAICSADIFEELFGYREESIDFTKEGLIFIKGTAPNGIREIKFSLAQLGDGHYYGNVDITLDDSTVMTPWNLALKLDRQLGWADIADIAVSMH